MQTDDTARESVMFEGSPIEGTKAPPNSGEGEDDGGGEQHPPDDEGRGRKGDEPPEDGREPP